jgi:hypothetical protein
MHNVHFYVIVHPYYISLVPDFHMLCSCHGIHVTIVYTELHSKIQFNYHSINKNLRYDYTSIHTKIQFNYHSIKKKLRYK